MSSNDYIVITGSRNLDEDEEGVLHKEGEDSSRRALEGEGVFLDDDLNGKEQTETLEPHDEFSETLKNVGDIEIISSKEDEY